MAATLTLPLNVTLTLTLTITLTLTLTLTSNLNPNQVLDLVKNPSDAARLPELWMLKEVTTQQGSLALSVPKARCSGHFPQRLAAGFGSAWANAMHYMPYSPKQPFLGRCELAPLGATRCLMSSHARGDVVNLSQQ